MQIQNQNPQTASVLPSFLCMWFIVGCLKDTEDGVKEVSWVSFMNSKHCLDSPQPSCGACCADWVIVFCVTCCFGVQTQSIKLEWFWSCAQCFEKKEPVSRNMAVCNLIRGFSLMSFVVKERSEYVSNSARNRVQREDVYLKVSSMALFPQLIVSLWTLYNCTPYRFSHLAVWKFPSSAGKQEVSFPIQDPLKGLPTGELFIKIKTFDLHSCTLWCLTDISSGLRLPRDHTSRIKRWHSKGTLCVIYILNWLSRKPAGWYFYLSIRVLTEINLDRHATQLVICSPVPAVCAALFPHPLWPAACLH